MAVAFFQKGDFKFAEEQYKILLKENEFSPVVIYDLAQTLYKQGRKNEAREYFLSFIDLYQDYLPELAKKASAIIKEQ